MVKNKGKPNHNKNQNNGTNNPWNWNNNSTPWGWNWNSNNNQKGDTSSNKKCKNCPGKTDHTTQYCKKNKCTNCHKQGHTSDNCKDQTCYNCGKRGHHGQDCTRGAQRNNLYYHDLVNNAPENVASLFDDMVNQTPHPVNNLNRTLPFQLEAQRQLHYGGQLFRPDPVQPEEIWCKWCNSLSHNTVNCTNDSQYRQILLGSDNLSNFCSRCGYKGHSGNLCCNPHPEARCWLCGRPGHSQEDCLRRDTPGFRAQMDRARMDYPNSGYGENRKALNRAYKEKVMNAHKQAKERMDQTWDVIDEIVNNSGTKAIDDVVPITEDQLVNIMPTVMAYKKGQPAVNWGVDISQTVVQMQWLHISDNFNFYLIQYAVHRVQAGYTVHCAIPKCPGKAGIVDTNFREIVLGSHNTFDINMTEHAVFLACTCRHELGNGTLVWKRSAQTQAQAEEPPAMKLLRTINENPSLKRYLNARFGGIEPQFLDFAPEEEATTRRQSARLSVAREDDKVHRLERQLNSLITAHRNAEPAQDPRMAAAAQERTYIPLNDAPAKLIDAPAQLIDTPGKAIGGLNINLTPEDLQLIKLFKHGALPTPQQPRTKLAKLPHKYQTRLKYERDDHDEQQLEFNGFPDDDDMSDVDEPQANQWDQDYNNVEDEVADEEFDFSDRLGDYEVEDLGNNDGDTTIRRGRGGRGDRGRGTRGGFRGSGRGGFGVGRGQGYRGRGGTRVGFRDGTPGGTRGDRGRGRGRGRIEKTRPEQDHGKSRQADRGDDDFPE